jgi:transcriptional regulator with XRE-family HTH domain
MASKLPRRQDIVRRNLKRLREEAGLSQAVASYVTGIPLANLQRWEQGRHAIDASDLKTLADAYGRSLDDFFVADPDPADAARQPVFRLLIMPGRDADPELIDEAHAVVDDLNRRNRAWLGSRKKRPTVGKTD